MRLALLCLFIIVSCGKHSTDHAGILQHREEPSTPPVKPEEIDPADMTKIADLLPTMYYIPQEEKTNCKGKYGTNQYNGTERSRVVSVDGSVIADVCTRFYKILLMEGSAVLSDKLTINVGGMINGERRFYVLNRCLYGEGVRKDLCLLPYHTLATDNKVHAIGDIIFVPKAVGLELPDGTKHEGYFIVRDTGGAFDGVGAQRVDMFTGLDPDYSNVFQKAGFDHKHPIGAFKIKGQSADLIKEKLQARFGSLY